MGSVLEIFSQNLVCGLHSQQKYVSFSLSLVMVNQMSNWSVDCSIHMLSGINFDGNFNREMNATRILVLFETLLARLLDISWVQFQLGTLMKMKFFYVTKLQ